jgi:hypothetical protein
MGLLYLTRTPRHIVPSCVRTKTSYASISFLHCALHSLPIESFITWSSQLQLTTTRLWSSALRSILPLFKYSIHAFLRNSEASEKTSAKLAEAGQVRAAVTWRCSQLLTRYRDCLKQFTQNIFLLHWCTVRVTPERQPVSTTKAKKLYYLWPFCW